MSARSGIGAGVMVGVWVAASGCGDSQLPPSVRAEFDTASWLQLGVIERSAKPAVPDTVVVGEPFEIVVTTYGNGCLSAPEDLQVTALPDGIILTPIDRWRPAGWVETGDIFCTDIGNSVEHRTTHVFHQVGERKVIIRGLGAEPSAAGERDTLFVEKSVTIVEPR